MAVFKDTNGKYFIQVSYRDNAGNVKSKKKQIGRASCRGRV